MKHWMLLTALSLMSFAAAQTGNEGPFGLRMGMTLADLQKIGTVTATNTKGVYTMRTVPIPNNNFEEYVVTVAPSFGLCKVSGYGHTIQANAFGDQLKERFNALKAAVTSRYGVSRDFDFLRTGSIWDEARDWMMALYRQERTLASFWMRDETPNVPAYLTGIHLQARALTSSTGYVSLGYEFANSSPCIDELKAASNDGL